MIAGEYRYRFRHTRRKKLPTPETVIAATARHYPATLWTNNPSDFPMSDIVVEQLGA
jgi:predicted nucleic acid-binding protein